MGSPAVAYLENAARKYALAAAKAEREGDYENALTNLRRAVDILEDIVKNYPEHPLTSLYKRLLAQYKRKVKDLEGKVRLQPATPEDEEYVVETMDQNRGDDLDKILPPFVVKVKPELTFEDIAGLEHAKNAMIEAIVYPVKRPDLFPLGWHRGVLLFGPPGTGKTMLAGAVAREAGAELLHADAASIMSKWLGEAEKNVRRLFTYARERASRGVPVIVFIDEVDALLGIYSTEVGGEARVRNQFLKEMDSILDKSLKIHMFVLGATNKPWKLDEAFLRRFQKRIYVPLPDKKARKQLLELLTKKIKLDSNINLEELAETLEGYSGSDIKDIVQDAYMKTVREVFEKGGAGEPRPVSIEDFKTAIAKRRPSVDPTLVAKFEEWASKFGAL